MIEIDGSRGEGGGQILRTSLSLAMITRQPVRIRNIRAGRAKPGLLAQHLAAVLAAEHVTGAAIDGAKLGSTMVEMVAGPMPGGTYRMEVGTAGSAALVLQTLLVPLLTARGPSRVVIEGGTHNQSAPPFDFLARAYLPALRRMGAQVELQLDRHGFYPAGGGRLVCTIEPSPLVAAAFEEAGPVRRRHARAIVAGLPRAVAERELAQVRKDLGWRADECEVAEVRSPGPGNVVVLEVERGDATEVVTGFGVKGVAAERIAAEATRELGRYLAANVPVGEHLADQLMLPMAIARGGRFRTLPLTPHGITNLETIARFLDVKVAVRPEPRAVTVSFGE